MNAPSLIQIQNSINLLQQERDRLPLFDLLTCQARINEAQIQATLHPEKRGDLVMALDAKKQAEAAHERARAIDKLLRNLNIERSMIEGDERKHRAEQADARLDEAHAEYSRKCMEVVRAWRALQQANTRNQSTPGSKRIQMPDFDFPQMNHPGSTFTTAQACLMGELYWEKNEREAA